MKMNYPWCGVVCFSLIWALNEYFSVITICLRNYNNKIIYAYLTETNWVDGKIKKKKWKKKDVQSIVVIKVRPTWFEKVRSREIYVQKKFENLSVHLEPCQCVVGGSLSEQMIKHTFSDGNTLSSHNWFQWWTLISKRSVQFHF